MCQLLLQSMYPKVKLLGFVFLFILNNFYLFVWLVIYDCAGSSLLLGLFSSFGEQELLLIVMHMLLIALACGTGALGCRLQELQFRGSRVQAQ